jgi:plastocyanin
MTRARLPIAVAAAIAAAAIVAAHVLGGLAPVRAADATVVIKDFEFVPSSVTVTAGSVVTWTNSAARPHTVTADDGTSFDSQPIGAGEAFANLFDTPGTFAYHCAIHPQMTGTVVVTAAASTPAASGTQEPTPPPGTLPPSFQPNPTPPPESTASAESATPAAPAESQTGTPVTGVFIGLGAVLAAVVVVAYLLIRRR